MHLHIICIKPEGRSRTPGPPLQRPCRASDLTVIANRRNLPT
ncbi:hypothetical protein STVIR_1093 [Streptomyces viridochromogenes Tue57]|uniref:Uncharacterized protein n=1 Tax=Streptomyces viridochromogenes Tue57 TaxID=1160705 RepID=L8PR95_STRVR|nr:hypothetical protein STVIR_1093 [Streptomyces viridochromogenes Tue57]